MPVHYPSVIPMLAYEGSVALEWLDLLGHYWLTGDRCVEPATIGFDYSLRDRSGPLLAQY